MFKLMVSRLDFFSERPLYLEFGVFKGASMRYWSQKLKNKAARLHGFDSFYGLPESWERLPKGTFSTHGKSPALRDPRVKIHPGWFQDTLPEYIAPPHDALIINFDADLYSSTKFVLEQLKAKNLLSAGSWLYFDEFTYLNQEFRAFKEFLAETGMRFKYVAETSCERCVIFQKI